MIGWLSGTVRERFSDRLLIDTGGVGYEVHVTTLTSASQGDPGSRAELYIHTNVREDEITLYGFSSLREREIFRLLTTVSGIGARTAIGILSAVSIDVLVTAIRGNHTAALQKAPGIGKRTAERMVVELRDRLKTFDVGSDGKAPIPRTGEPLAEDVVSALLNLGYKRPDVESAVSHVDVSKYNTFDRILRETLKALSR